MYCLPSNVSRISSKAEPSSAISLVPGWQSNFSIPNRPRIFSELLNGIGYHARKRGWSKEHGNKTITHASIFCVAIFSKVFVRVGFPTERTPQSRLIMTGEATYITEDEDRGISAVLAPYSPCSSDDISHFENPCPHCCYHKSKLQCLMYQLCKHGYRILFLI